MVGIYLIVSLICQLQPVAGALPVSLSSTAAQSPEAPTAIIAGFDELNGIHVGAPVVAQGLVVGSVGRITSADSNDSQQKSADTAAPFGVQLLIQPKHRNILKDGIVALVSSPLHKKNSPAALTTVVELLAPQTKPTASLLPGGSIIRGFSSFERFWASPFA